MREETSYVTVVFDRDTFRILVEAAKGKFYIPRIKSAEVPSEGYKMTEFFRADFQDYINTTFDLVFLYSTINETFHRHIPVFYIAMFESRTPVNPDPGYGFMWLDVRDVEPECFPSYPDVSALPWIRRIQEECSEKGVRPWEKPGWLQTTTEIATVTLRRLGYEVVSAFKQFRVTPNSSILTVQTKEGLIYLKASDKREGKMTECISDVEPRFARKPLYVDTEREWMLMEDYGESLDERLSRTDFENVKDLLGRLQRKTESQIQRLIDGGVPRVDPDDIARRVKKMLEDVFLSDDIENALRNVEKPGVIERFDDKAIRNHCRCVRALLKHLYEDQKIPLTLVHGDIIAWNIVKFGSEKDSYLLIDWQTATIDLPLKCMDYLGSHIAPREDQSGVSVDSYLQHWAEYGTLEELKKLRECFALKELLVRYVIHYEYGVDKGLRPYLDQDNLTGLCEILREVTETVYKLER